WFPGVSTQRSNCLSSEENCRGIPQFSHKRVDQNFHQLSDCKYTLRRSFVPSPKAYCAPSGARTAKKPSRSFSFLPAVPYFKSCRNREKRSPFASLYSSFAPAV